VERGVGREGGSAPTNCSALMASFTASCGSSCCTSACLAKKTMALDTIGAIFLAVVEFSCGAASDPCRSSMCCTKRRTAVDGMTSLQEPPSTGSMAAAAVCIHKGWMDLTWQRVAKYCKAVTGA
jgi:hypothetical protein